MDRFLYAIDPIVGPRLRGMNHLGKSMTVLFVLDAWGSRASCRDGVGLCKKREKGMLSY